MRVLFLDTNPAFIYGLPNGFRAAGHEVMVSGPLTQSNIPQFLSEFCPDLVVTMGWSFEYTPVKQGWIREYVQAAGIPHAYWAAEDPDHTHDFTLPLYYQMRPDFIFTICPSMVSYYRSLGIPAAYLDYGYEPSIHHPAAPTRDYRCSIAIVANGYPEDLTHFARVNIQHTRIQSIATLVRPLLEANIQVDFWGDRWYSMAPFVGRDIPDAWLHGILPNTEAHKVYSSSDIVIGFQNNALQRTMRTYEVLASGGFLLTLDTPAVRELFVPGRDLVVSSSPEETLRLVHYYLEEHPDERNQIRQQGQLAVFGHVYENRADYMLSVLHNHGILRTD